MGYGYLVVSPEYPPMVIGGPGHHMYHVANGLAEQDWEVVVVTFHRGDTVTLTEEAGVRVVRVPLPKTAPSDFIAKYLWQAEWLTEHVPELPAMQSSEGIVATQGYFLWRPAWRWAREKGWPLVAHSASLLSTSFEGTDRDKAFFLEEESRLYNTALLTVSPSHWLKDEISTKCSTSQSSIEVVPKAVDMAQFQPWSSPPDAHVVTYVGRLSPEKGVHILLEAMSRVATEIPDVLLKLVGVGGDAEYVAHLHKQVRDNSLAKHVLFAGGVSEEELPTVYRATAVVAIPSLHESFGRVAIEAMAAGRLVVASDVEGLGEVLHGISSAVLVPPRDSNSLANGIIQALRMPESSLVDRVAQGMSAVREYDWPAVFTHTTEAYTELLHR